VNKLLKISMVLAFVLAISAVPAFAQPDGGGATGANSTITIPQINFSKAFGAGLVVVGAAMGIGRLASAAYESMARQPEVAGTINTAMIIAAALIEGFTFYALYICSTQV
jgi:F-type H+-transporting ATPase subunit c